MRHLLAAGLVEGTVLAVAAADRAHELRRALGATVVEPGEMAFLDRRFRTVIDLDGFATAPPHAHARYARLLADAVEPAGFLHVLVPSDRDAAGRVRPGVTQSDLLGAFGGGWSLVCMHDASMRSRAGGRRHAWLATFVHGPARRRRPPPVVRGFTDRGTFGSGSGPGSPDLGATQDRPPWGS